MSDTWRIVVLLLAAGFIAEAVLLVAVMRQVGGLLLRAGPIRGDAPGGPQIDTVVEIPGHAHAKRPTLVVFTSSSCSHCKELAPELRRMQADYGRGAHYGQQLDLVAVVTDARAETREKYAAELGSFARTDLIALMQDWSVPGTPFAVAVDADSRARGATVLQSVWHLEMLAVEALGLRPVPQDSPSRIQSGDSLNITQVTNGKPDSAEVVT